MIGTIPDHFPLLVRVKRVTIRNVAFYLKDLFLGYKGALEKKGVKEEALYVDFLESTRTLQLEKFRVGHTINSFMVAWVKSLVPQVGKKVSLLGSATNQIVGSIFSSLFDFGGNKKNANGVLHQDKKAKKPSVIGRIKEHIAAKLVKKTWQKVTAHDSDYFLPTVISGIIEKRTSRMKKWVHAFMELKGCTLFYADCTKEGMKMRPEKKLDLSQATAIKLISGGHKEIQIVNQYRNRWIRVPVEVAGPSIKEWFKQMQSHQRRNLKGIIKITLIRANGVTKRLGHNLHVTASILNAGHVEDHAIKPAKSKGAKVSQSTVTWSEEIGTCRMIVIMIDHTTAGCKIYDLIWILAIIIPSQVLNLYVGPLVASSKSLHLELSYSGDSHPTGCITLPLTAITARVQDFTLPWKPLSTDKKELRERSSARLSKARRSYLPPSHTPLSLLSNSNQQLAQQQQQQRQQQLAPPVAQSSSEQMQTPSPHDPTDPSSSYASLPVGGGGGRATPAGSSSVTPMTTEPVAAGSPRHSRKNSETSRPTASSAAAAAGAAGSFQEKSSNWKRTVSKSSSDWIGNLVFKAQLHEHLVMYKHNMYVDPTAAESGRKGFRSPYDRAAAKNALQINEGLEAVARSDGKHHRGFLSFASSTLGGIPTSLGGYVSERKEKDQERNTVRDWHSNDINKLAEKLLLTSQKAGKGE
eukprot:jgi/Bigna1/68517/fgenesh1_pg.6_\